MSKAYIIHATRTPIGSFNGALSSVRVDDLMANLLTDFKKKWEFSLELLDDVMIGNANQAGEDNRNLARMSLLLAEYPFSVPGTTVNRLCGSSLDATIYAYSRIMAGMGDFFLVGGAESMSRAPYVFSKAENSFDRSQTMYDTSIGWRFPNPKMKELFPLYTMGETAEEVAKLLNISREKQDAFAFSSHTKALQAQKEGKFTKEIIPVEIKGKKESRIISQDEGPRSDSTLEKLAKLKAAFRDGGTVTAGNSSSINDGASLMAIVSETFLKRYRLTPLAAITGFGIKGTHPNTMGLGPVDAVIDLCRRVNMRTGDFDLIELNEAFAAQALGVIEKLGLDQSKINVNGGAIALGHPLGSSGTRILGTLIHEMNRNPSKYKTGLATMCIGMGQGIAVSVENCL
ncbi:MAG: thiolase family protein [Bacteriovoracaceae bacterium]